LDELRKIGIGAPCQKCKQQLTQTHYSKVERDYFSEMENLQKKLEEISKKVLETNSRILENSAKEKDLKKKEKKLNDLRQQLAKLHQQDERTREDEEKLSKKQQLLEEKNRQLEQESYGQEERDQLAQATNKLEELKPAQLEYETIKDRLKTLEKMRTEQQFITSQEKVAKKDEVTEELKKEQQKGEALEKEVEGGKALLLQKNEEYEKEKPVLEKIRKLEKEKEKEDLDRECEQKNGEMTGKSKDIQQSEGEIKRIMREIQTREEQLEKLYELNQYKLWLSEFFIPAVKLIETNVLANINSEFNSLFQKWFGHLLEAGDISVRVDDNFTPIIEQNGYEMEVDSLSGGEKTSVALAYRLALNVMVKKVCEAMQSNLLILDEPTDGFSREQLFRLRDILTELRCEQVIAVSHDSELEGFVDKIYRVTKEAGESKISVA
jgi:exonuclease SbcC